MVIYPLNVFTRLPGFIALAGIAVADVKLADLIDGVAPSFVAHPVQQPVLLVKIHPGDQQGRRLRDLVVLPAFHDPRHLEAVFNGRQVGNLGSLDLKGLRHIVPDAPRKRLTSLPALDVGLRQTLRLVGQQGVGLHPLPVGLDHCRLLLPLRHGRQHPAKHGCPLIRSFRLPQGLNSSHAAVAGDQAIGAGAGRDHRRRLQKAVGPDGVHQGPQRLRVRRWIEVPGVVPDIVNRDLHHGVRIGHRFQRRSKLGDVKVFPRHAHPSNPSISSAARRR